MRRHGWLLATLLATLLLAACDLATVPPVAEPPASEPSAEATPSSPATDPTDAPTDASEAATPAPSEAAPGEPSEAPTQASEEPATPTTGCDGAGVVVCDGFEDQQAGATPAGEWSVTAPDCSGTGVATVDGEVAHAGSTSVRVDGAAGYCNHVFVTSAADLGAMGDVWYVRMWVRHTTALPAAHVTFVSMTDAVDGRHLRMGGQNGALQFNRESDDATLPEQSPAGVALSQPLATDTWSCVEFSVDGAAGTIATWVDGEQVPGLQADGTPTADVDGQWLNSAWSPQLTDLGLGWESYGEGADTLWFDDVVIGSERTGC